MPQIFTASTALVATLLVASTARGAATAQATAPIRWTYNCSAGKNITSFDYDLHNQTWLITGSDGRLGTPVTAAALRAGAAVVATSRTEEAATANCDNLRKEFGADAPVLCIAMDLSSFDSVRGAVKSIDARYPHVDVLLHVAATLGLNNITADGFVETVQVNVLSPVLINKLLLKSGNGEGANGAAAARQRAVHVGSANCYDPLGWPAEGRVDTAMKWIKGTEPHPNLNETTPYYWYSFTK